MRQRSHRQDGNATGDILRGESQKVADRARDDGVEAQLELYPIDAHIFHHFWSFLPEAADALDAAGRFIREVVQDTRAATSQIG